MGYLVAREAKEALEVTNQNTTFTFFFFPPPLSLPLLLPLLCLLNLQVPA